MRETYLFYSHLFGKEAEEFFGFGSSGHPLDTGIDIFSVFAEDVHIDLLGLFYGRDHTSEPAYGTQADIEVEFLTQSDVQRTDTASDWGCQRAFDSDTIVAEGLHGLVGQPGAGLFEGFTSGQDLFPKDSSSSVVCFFDSGVNHLLGSGRDFGTYSVSFDKGDLYFVGHQQCTGFVDRNFTHFFVYMVVCVNSLLTF